MLYLCIVAKGDIPVYEVELSSAGKVDLKSISFGKRKLSFLTCVRFKFPFCFEQKEDLNQFIVHSALDMVDQKVWSVNTMFLREVDKFNDQSISAFCTAGRMFASEYISIIFPLFLFTSRALLHQMLSSCCCMMFAWMKTR
jgi:hypothetical protein